MPSAGKLSQSTGCHRMEHFARFKKPSFCFSAVLRAIGQGEGSQSGCTWVGYFLSKIFFKTIPICNDPNIGVSSVILGSFETFAAFRTNDRFQNSYRDRLPNMPWNDALPIQAFEQRLELRSVDRNYTIRHARPDKAATFDPLVSHHQASSVPDDEFHSIRSLRTKNEDGSAERKRCI